ncbi:hypothetical protein DO97_05735 [Neosynechococcus sphagnicola sy1]|uniref:VWFA domain-containing protein n=1 Tax=Neosynechococcus sphagnicola sy1 TaxID=1497020 RepID=A0A098TNK0_9CYAN|nr:hypothetical protein [Neosynechococcus sphagnicola]KGF73869.1 hypothetical protein DO97_05735 [Neosynechococcus sphagnicola sy1]
MSYNTPNVNTLFQTACDDGILSTASLQALDVLDIGIQIQAALGVPVDDVTASEVVLVTVMPDDSGSIRFGNNAAAVRAGHNTVLDALRTSNQKDAILIHNRYLNGRILYPYCSLSQAVRMDNKNYDPNLGTPLYDQMVVLLGTVLAKSQEFADNGVPVRTVTLLITDGADAGSTRATAKTVKTLVQDMLRSENHIIAAMGIDDSYTDFRQVFSDMGIRDQWMLTPGNNQADIRKAFQVFSQSAVRASQSAANFSQSAMGGFGNP